MDSLSQQDNEVWVPIFGTHGWYDVSNHGRVRSWLAGNSKKRYRRVKPKILTPGDSYGYPQYVLYMDGIRKHVKAHTLVALHFIGPRPEGLQIRHIDGDKSNCRVDNLEYGTPSQNSLDRREHGTEYLGPGEQNPHAKLQEDDVILIRSLRADGVMPKELSDRFGVSVPTICNIVARRKWRHI